MYPHATIGHKHATAASRRLSSAGRISFNNTYVSARTECFMRQSRVRGYDGTETATPGYMLLGLAAGTDIQRGGTKIAEIHVTAENLLNRAYQNHLSRLKYADINNVTGRCGVYGMGRDITFKLIVPVTASIKRGQRP